MKEKKKGGFFKAAKEFAYGVAAHDSARFALKTRASMEHLFILITMGDMLGVPYYLPTIRCVYCLMWCHRSPRGRDAC